MRLGGLPPEMLQRVEAGFLVSPVLVRVLRESLKWEREMIELQELAIPGSGDVQYHKFILDGKVQGLEDEDKRHEFLDKRHEHRMKYEEAEYKVEKET